ncbi:ABC-type cobalamin/Fe3+-siderophores transport system, ATPase component [Flaviramulus basaltis]|uniref:ABC-type cobalamin/Fe3+-siderophores transport system, ATPase component n=1 Tax=Flaviramulus basaltis TaxID=369401 RepID=A0A1K2IIW6_9FLAO|nr:ABC transporter ATP-binding protein [Flaviramulus basaltis]SFZ92246.1 ABC-type cobalamin/Fe3+-siderophores transport system, ATPase component [Flaviramulus basaltis]
MIIEIDNVELYFKEKCILNGIYLKAETGKTTGILGSNGCGKSCLLNILFGNLKPKYKLVRVNNKPILKPLFQTKLVAYLPQYNFIPNTVKLKSAFKLFKVSWYDFINTFETFRIYKNSKINKLSGGERRLIETYIILKSDRKIVLLDEPFSHLAPLHIEKIKMLISEMKQHKIIIITDHMYRHIIDISDDIYLIKNRSTKLINNINELKDHKYLSTHSLD